MSISQPIVDLLEDYLDGNLDPWGHDALMSWVSISDENARAVAEWFVTEVQLVEASRLAEMQAVFGALTHSWPRTPAEQEATPSSSKKKLQTWHWIAAAASLGFICVAAGIWMSFGIGANRGEVAAEGSRWRTKTNRTVEESRPAPAILSRLEDCVWAQGAKQLRVGCELSAGTELDLKSGLAQVVFESGAEVVLKGPCEFRIENAMLGCLARGTLSAEVPWCAAGFTIRGPSSEVIDLGTRFGFAVGSDGNSEVHVFQGEVISRELDEHGRAIGNDFRLKKDQAVLFPGAKRQAQRLAANEAKFAVEVRPLWQLDQIEPLAVDRDLVLWLRAAHGVQTDRRNRVVAWQDLALGNNHIANDAFQPDAKSRPEYRHDAFLGLPGIRFDGTSSYLTTVPMTTTDDQTIVVVFQYASRGDGPEPAGGQIINYNGPPSRYLPDVYGPGVLQLGEKIDSRNGPPGSIAAKAFVGRDSSGADVSAGIVGSQSLGFVRPRVATYVYNNSGNVASLYVDGARVAESSAPTKVAVTSRKVIGKHGIFDQWYFQGDLAELVIFNAALTPTEVETLSRQLMVHYGLDSNPNGSR